MANRRGNINLDITSILLALLENFERIDFDLQQPNIVLLGMCISQGLSNGA
jgi:hypothetical protein